MTIYKVRRKDDGKVYECFAQMVDLNFNNKYVLRYNIGTQTYFDGWKNFCCVYSNEEFNERYEVISEERR